MHKEPHREFDPNVTVVLTTDRLKLRTFRESDLPLFAAINADIDVMTYIGGTALTRRQSDEIALGAQRSLIVSGYGKIAVERVADRAFLGTCGLSNELWYPNDLENRLAVGPAILG